MITTLRMRVTTRSARAAKSEKLATACQTGHAVFT